LAAVGSGSTEAGLGVVGSGLATAERGRRKRACLGLVAAG